MPPSPGSPRATLQTMRTLWAALTLSTAIFAFLYFGVLRAGVHPRAVPPALVGGLAMVAVVNAVLSFVIPQRVFLAATRQRPPPEGATADQQLAALLRAYTTPFILSMALSETVSLFGLVVGMLGGGDAVPAAFFAAGGVLCLMRFPTEAGVRAAAR